MVAWKWGPALAAGCTVVLKPAEQTPLTALRMGELAHGGRLPRRRHQHRPRLRRDRRRRARRAPGRRQDRLHRRDRRPARSSCRPRPSNLKRVTLELGGKSPNIVFADADLDAAVDGAILGLFFNQGQCCCAGSRLFVQEKVYDEFVEKLADEGRRAASSATRSTRRPSRARRSTRPSSTRSWATSTRARSRAPSCVTGGERLGDKGYFIEPTVFADVKDEMAIASDEIFGPVMQVLKFKDIDEVDRARQHDRLRPGRRRLDPRHRQGPRASPTALRAGTVWVNCYDVFDAAAPFGGFKQSASAASSAKTALDNYTELKTVTMAL